MMTSKSLTRMGVQHYVIVEPDQVDDYNNAIKEMQLTATVLPLDMNYKTDYELCDNLGQTRSTGPGPARNFAWQHSIDNGFDWHWVMDDNIRSFRRLNYNEKVKCESPSFWNVMEDFVLRYNNVAMAGPNYYMFAPARTKQPPFMINTRIYSCNLIRNDVSFRWRGRYNEDTIISLDMLKAGWTTIQFNAFLQEKMNTQVIKGGNTEEFYHKEGEKEYGKKYADLGTLAKSQMLVDVHPDLCRVVHKFGRIHHTVNYSVFKKQRLIKKANIDIKKGINNYNMSLKAKENAKAD